MKNPESEYELILFRGFGGNRHVCVAGRVVKRSQLVPERYDPGWSRRLRDGWRLLISRRLAHAEIELSCGSEVWRIRSDRHGYFFSCREIHIGDDVSLWSRYRARLLGPDTTPRVEASSEVLHALPSADQVVISDIDDTLVRTGVANKIMMLWRLYVSRAGDRAPFPRVSGFLRGLHGGRSGQAANPIIYISRSPWSIYPMLDELFNNHDIPIGPVLLLRDWGISWRHPFPRRAESHKANMIKHVLEAFPDLPVILIGDSGQHDPEVYAAAVERHPGRIAGIYIRDLAVGTRRSRVMNRLARQLEREGVHFHAAASTEAMIADAIIQGWIVGKTP